MSLFEPDQIWPPHAARIGTVRGLRHLIVLAAVGAFGIALATEIGVRLFNTEWNYVAGYSVQRSRSWQPFFVLWLCALLLPFVQGVIAASLLPMYSKPRLWLRSVTVFVVGSIPIYVAGLALIVLPGLLLVIMAFLVSCVWWASGAREVLGLHASDAPDFIGASLIGSAGVMFLLSASVPI